MNTAAVIIPSANFSNLMPCVNAVRLHEPQIPIVIVGDGIFSMLLRPQMTFIPGIQPFIFARNINLGIRTAMEAYSPQGFILLNDDALLQTPGGFQALAEDAEARADYGVISAVTNSAGNPNQFSRGSGFREEHHTLCFVCVYVSAKAIRVAGFLDERFTAYGWEDNDYCRRVRQAQMKLGISERCFVDHLSLRSTFRGDPRAAADITAGAEIYRAKWGSLA